MITSIMYSDVGKEVEVTDMRAEPTILAYDNMKKEAKIVINPQGAGNDWKGEPAITVGYELIDIIPEETKEE